MLRDSARAMAANVPKSQAAHATGASAAAVVGCSVPPVSTTSASYRPPDQTARLSSCCDGRRRRCGSAAPTHATAKVSSSVHSTTTHSRTLDGLPRVSQVSAAGTEGSSTPLSASPGCPLRSLVRTATPPPRTSSHLYILAVAAQMPSSTVLYILNAMRYPDDRATETGLCRTQ